MLAKGPNHPKTCHCLLTAHMAQLLTELQAEQKLGEEVFQGVVRVELMQNEVRLCAGRDNGAVLPPFTPKTHNSVSPSLSIRTLHHPSQV